MPRDDLAAFVRIGEQASHYEAARKEGTKSYTREIPKCIETNARRIDDALKEIAVCDPAIGSGAFPVGMMTEIVRARTTLTPYLPADAVRATYQLKRHAIQSSLYGVDVDPSAVDIAKLRLWLSLVVDEEDPEQIRALPNLDYKIVVGDSLLGYPFRTQGAEQIETLKRRYFDSTSHAKKEELRADIDRRIREALAGSKRALGYAVSFDYKLFFSEVFEHGRGGFDVVIANPPYVSAWSMEAESPGYRKIVQNQFSSYDVLTGHWDLFVAFVALGHSILRKGGVLSYILPNPVLREKYASALRRFLLEKTRLKSVLIFDETNVFERVSRKVTVIVLRASAADESAIQLLGNARWGTSESAIVHRNEIPRATWYSPPAYRFELDSAPEEDALIRKIEGGAPRVGNYFYVNYGAQVSSKEKGRFKKADVVGTVRKGKAKRFFEGKDLHRWSIEWRGLYLDYRKSELYGPRSEELFDGPKVAVRHLSDPRHRIAAALDYDGLYCDHGVILAVPYGAVEGTALAETFAGYERREGSVSVEFLIASILSPISQYYYLCQSSTQSLQQTTSHIYPQAVRALPLRLPDRKVAKRVESVVTEIVTAKTRGDEDSVSRLEAELNAVFYALYDLSPVEIGQVGTRLAGASETE